MSSATVQARKDAIRTRLQGLPEKPGVYLMKDADGEVIYVGKAKVLKHRVRSYFTNKRLDNKTIKLVSQIRDFEYIVTDTEKEALLLEITLIKKYSPKYNVIFKDDKRPPYIKVTVQEEFPRVLRVRNIEDDGSRYFGPYADGGSAARTIALIDRIFPLCSREVGIDGRADRPCLQYYIGRCMGACAGRADPDKYRKAVNEVIGFLEGKRDDHRERIRTAMEAAAERLDFEKAKELHDQMKALDTVLERQKVVLPSQEDVDIIAVAVEEKEACAEVLYVRSGRLSGHRRQITRDSHEDTPEAIQQAFVEQHYAEAATIPSAILVQYELLDPEPVEELLRSKRRARVPIHVPKRGEKKALLELAVNNAKEGLEQERFKWLSDEQKRTGALLELQTVLGLPEKPKRLECFDISNVQGTNPVASMVVFEDGQPARGEYRKFQIKTVQGPNDFEMMREALSRRFKRAADPSEDGSSWRRLPDLLVVDGGKGQLGVAVEVLAEAGLSQVPVVSLAKRIEEIFVPGRPESILLPRNSEALYLMQRLRDEAHRFAITYHRGLRSKAQTKSPLDEVVGIGPKRKKALIRAFGSLEGIRRATVDEVAAVKGVDRATAERVKEKL